MSETNTKIYNTKFQSPVPFFFKLRDLIFGKQRPGIFTQITFYLNLVAFLLFALWSIISYYLLLFRDLFLEEKGVDVEAIIEGRGNDLGFEPGVFLERLENFHFVSMICWAVLFFSLVLLWRKSKAFVVFYFGATIVYISCLLFYLGIGYYISDTTLFDKSVFVLMNLYTFLYFILSHLDREEV